jgi:hypothetical protein
MLQLLFRSHVPLNLFFNHPSAFRISFTAKRRMSPLKVDVLSWQGMSLTVAAWPYQDLDYPSAILTDSTRAS